MTRLTIVAARNARFEQSPLEKRSYADQVYRAGWTSTCKQSHISALNKATRLKQNTGIVVGDRVLITQNVRQPSFLPNRLTGGAVVDDDAVSVRTSNGTTHCIGTVAVKGGFELRRNQIPLVMACASTVHTCQGRT